MTPSEIAAHAATLKQFATNTEGRVLDAIELTGSIAKAALSLGLSRSTLNTHMRNLGARAAKRGWSPEHDMTKVAPEPFVVKGTSTLYDAEGEPKLQWVKTRLDDQRAEALLLEMAAGLAETLPRLPALPAPAHTDAALATVYTITDAHIGQHAWAAESGVDWDLKIAERTIVDAFADLIERSPNAAHGIIGQLGDFLHFDGILPLTPTSGHVLDADSRFAKVVAVAIRVLRTVVPLVLDRHERVSLVISEGNHDIASSTWLRLMFAALYENEPRLTVINEPRPHHVITHGAVMLAWHHGHLIKPASLPLVLAAEYPREWGNTTHRYAHVGHRHHEEVKDHPGIRIHQHTTLAARDAYASRHGFISPRQATALTYHERHGLVGTTVTVPLP